MDYNVSLTLLAGSNDTFTAMFPGGTNIFTFRVQIIDDSVFEGREDFTLKLDVETIVRSREGIRLVHPNTTAITIVTMRVSLPRLVLCAQCTFGEYVFHCSHGDNGTPYEH